jgi:hypothetical protein
MKISTLCRAGAALLALPAWAVWQAPVALPPLAREELAAVTLNSNVFATAREDYADLRILDDEGRAVPFTMQEASESRRVSVRRPCAVAQPEARQENNRLTLLYRLEQASLPPSGLTVETPLRDFRQQLRIEGSRDGAAWELLREGAEIYALERFVDVRACDAAWTPGAWRHYRVTLLEAEADRPAAVREVTRQTSGTDEATAVRQEIRREPFRVDRIRFWREEERETARVAVLTAYPLPRIAVEEHKETCRLVFRGWRAPLTQITFATGERLFSRRYRLYGRDDAARWSEAAPGRLLASGTLTSVRFQEIVHTAMVVAFPAARCHEYVLELERRQGEEIDVTVAKAEGLTPRPVFVAHPGRQYRLEFGGASHGAPRSPAIVSLLAGGGQPLAATLGDTTGTPPPGGWRAGLTWLNSRGAMFGGMALLGVVLAAILVRIAREAARGE